jgi:hypothetical protein
MTFIAMIYLIASPIVTNVQMSMKDAAAGVLEKGKNPLSVKENTWQFLMLLFDNG